MKKVQQTEQLKHEYLVVLTEHHIVLRDHVTVVSIAWTFQNVEVAKSLCLRIVTYYLFLLSLLLHMQHIFSSLKRGVHTFAFMDGQGSLWWEHAHCAFPAQWPCWHTHPTFLRIPYDFALALVTCLPPAQCWIQHFRVQGKLLKL